jgi:hypothetical protein
MKKFRWIERMTEKETARGMLPKPHSMAQGETSHDFLENILRGKIGSLADILAGIETAMQDRQLLSQNFFKKADEHYLYVKNKLLELSALPFGASPFIEARRTALEHEMDAITREKRNEMIQCWHDVNDLTKEFRLWMKQHNELRQRADLIMPTRADRMPPAIAYGVSNYPHYRSESYHENG